MNIIKQHKHAQEITATSSPKQAYNHQYAHNTSAQQHTISYPPSTQGTDNPQSKKTNTFQNKTKLLLVYLFHKIEYLIWGITSKTAIKTDLRFESYEFLKFGIFQKVTVEPGSSQGEPGSHKVQKHGR